MGGSMYCVKVEEVVRSLGYEIDLKFEVIDVVDGRISVGGTSRSEVERMISDRRKSIEEDLNVLIKRIERVCSGLERLHSEVESVLS